MIDNAMSVQLSTVTAQVVGSVLTLRAGPGWSKCDWRNAINATGFITTDMIMDDQISGFDYAIEDDGTEVWTITK